MYKPVFVLFSELIENSPFQRQIEIATTSTKLIVSLSVIKTFDNFFGGTKKLFSEVKNHFLVPKNKSSNVLINDNEIIGCSYNRIIIFKIFSNFNIAMLDPLFSLSLKTKPSKENSFIEKCSPLCQEPYNLVSTFLSCRYSGKTQKQMQEFVRENYVKRQSFQR